MSCSYFYRSIFLRANLPNVRCVSVSLKALLLVEMVARVVVADIRDKLRRTTRTLPLALESQYLKVALCGWTPDCRPPFPAPTPPLIITTTTEPPSAQNKRTSLTLTLAGAVRANECGVRQHH